jgi:hypothetical protein
MKTQGTHVYVVDNTGSDPIVHKFQCPTGITGLLSGSTDEIDVTCLDANSKAFELGLSDQGELSVPFIFDPTATSHRSLIDIVQAKTATQIAICCSDGTNAPTLDSDGLLVAPATRTSFIFSGLIKNPPLDFAGNEVVRGTMAIRVSGAVKITFLDGTVKTLG